MMNFKLTRCAMTRQHEINRVKRIRNRKKFFHYYFRLNRIFAFLEEIQKARQKSIQRNILYMKRFELNVIDRNCTESSFTSLAFRFSSLINARTSFRLNFNA